MPDKAAKQLVGHSLTSQRDAGATPGYQKRREVAELRQYIARLQPELPIIAEFNVVEGMEAMRHAVELKRTRVSRGD